MENELETRSYELAYHLSPDLEENQVRSEVQELQNLITQNGGAILFSREPQQRHLSYPIRHKRSAYFGVFDFNGSPEIVERIQSQLKLQAAILRHLLTQKPTVKEIRTLGEPRVRPRLKTHEPSPISRPAEEVKPEQMEKEIEEVLEKI